MNNQWMPIESAEKPAANKDVLCVLEWKDGARNIGKFLYDAPDFYPYEDDWIRVYTITHWQPMPELPPQTTTERTAQ